MARKRLTLAGVLLLLAVLLGLCFWLLRSKQPRQTVTLASGSTVTFAEVSYGKKSVIAPTGSWQSRLAFLPYSLLKRLKIYPAVAYPMQSNQLVIWFYVTPQGSADLFNSSANSFSLVDENGVECFSPSYWPYSFPPAAGSKGFSVIGMDLGAFPRRAKGFRMRIYSKDANEKLTLRGEIKIPNPAWRSYSQWRPDPLPITKTNGDVTITLTKLLTGTSMFSSEAAATNEESWGKASFTFTRAGKPTRDWAVDSIEFSDATGNRAPPSAWSDELPKSARDTFNFRVPLWRTESAWKLNVAFKRKPGAKFAPDELWSITNIALPALNSTNVLDLQSNLTGVALGFHSLVDESGMLPPETLTNYHRVRLIFQVPSLPPNVRFDVLSVTGHDAQTNAHSLNLNAAPVGTVGHHEFFYLLPVSAKTLDVKIGIYRQLTAEFIVSPRS